MAVRSLVRFSIMGRSLFVNQTPRISVRGMGIGVGASIGISMGGFEKTGVMSQAGRGLRLLGMLTGGMGGFWAEDGSIAPEIITSRQLKLNKSARLQDLKDFRQYIFKEYI